MDGALLWHIKFSLLHLVWVTGSHFDSGLVKKKFWSSKNFELKALSSCAFPSLCRVWMIRGQTGQANLVKTCFMWSNMTFNWVKLLRAVSGCWATFLNVRAQAKRRTAEIPGHSHFVLSFTINWWRSGRNCSSVRMGNFLVDSSWSCGHLSSIPTSRQYRQAMSKVRVTLLKVPSVSSVDRFLRWVIKRVVSCLAGTDWHAQAKRHSEREDLISFSISDTLNLCFASPSALAWPNLSISLVTSISRSFFRILCIRPSWMSWSVKRVVRSVTSSSSSRVHEQPLRDWIRPCNALTILRRPS